MQKKHKLEIGKILKIFGSLIIEQVFLYLVKNVSNLIFIKFEDGFLLAILILPITSKFRSYRHIKI